jgi:hypothetical protein
MQSYGVARGVFNLLGFCCWLCLIGGAILAVVGGINAIESNIGILPLAAGVIFFLFGFAGTAFIQAARASVDTAEYTQQALQVSRDQLSISRELLTIAKQPQTGSSFQRNTASDGLQDVSIDTDGATAALPETSATPSALSKEADSAKLEQSVGYKLGKMVAGRSKGTAGTDGAKVKQPANTEG